MLHFNQQQIDEFAPMKDVIDSIDTAYHLYHRENFHMPTRTQVENGDNTLVLMPCFTENYIATKLITVYPENSAKGLPTIQGNIILNCNQTGETIATFDGTYLTAVRTGAIGGNAVRHLAKQNVKTLAVIGTGVQGFYQTLAACEERNFEQIHVYNRTKGEKVSKFIKKLKGALHSNIKISEKQTPEETIKDADVVIAATNSNAPVLPDDSSLLKNKLFIGIGSFQPKMNEFPLSFFDNVDHILVDSEDAIKESGDLIKPLEEGKIVRDDIQTLASFIKNPTFDVESKDKTIFFKSTGMALFDAVSAADIYNASLATQKRRNA